MDNVLPVEQLETLDEREGEPLDETQTEPLVIVLLYQLVQVQAGGDNVKHILDNIKDICTIREALK